MYTDIEQVAEFDAHMGKIILQLQLASNAEEMGKSLVELAPMVKNAVSDLVRWAAERLKEAPIADSDELLMAYHINFQWAEISKAYLLLWRDTTFELSKGIVGLEDGKFDSSALKGLVQAGKSILEEASSDLSAQLSSGLAALQPVNRENKKKLGSWRLQKNPWPIYEEQFDEIPSQCARIWDNNRELIQVGKTFNQAREIVLKMIDDCKDLSTKVRVLVKEASSVCQELMATNPEKNLGKMAAKLEDFEGMLEFPQLMEAFNPEMEECLTALPESLDVPVRVNGGMLELHEIAFQRSTKTWVKAELMPPLYEIWELVEANQNESRMTFVNLQNWSIMLSNEVKDGNSREVDPTEFTYLVNELHKRLESSLEVIQRSSAGVRAQIQDEFRLANIYSPDQEFLPAQIQSTIEQLRENQDKFFEGIRKFFVRLIERARMFLKLVEHEESLSTSEKVIRFLKEREPDASNAQYSSIFLTKGFVSTSFIVGRKDEFKHAQEVIANWRKGYPGSLLLSGQRLSGKSLFGELIATRCFDHRTIRLQANSIFTVEGRKHETSCDLGHALEQIKKHSISQPTLIWIDDLESWWDKPHSYFDNGKALKNFLEHQGRNTFVMVSMGNTLRPRLEKLLDWNNAFLAHINLDKMSAAEIREAILIRHSATHQKLVGPNGDELTPQEYKKLTNAIHSSAGGNIGEALNQWAFSTHFVDESTVTSRFKSGYSLPDFLDPDLAILLSSIVMQRRTKESRLRRKFGPAFSPKYSLLVRRLLNTGVLKRGIDGSLEVNPILVNSLGDMLHRKRYLRYKD